ncbi:glycosyltransferase family 4 protein [Caulobacter sp. 17J80-11]|uniref:glycosyltransferase family 4 protein n=1 Tax=Caulobacter sp. 17J80-11 TaxID=2763502 RepID=UPI00351C4F75
MRSCVIVVENLPVPFDRRVWQEACALRDAGWRVSVICPATDKYPVRFERLEGIDVWRHPLPLEADGKFAFLVEYLAALFHEARLLVKVWRGAGFDVIHACNPPDLIFLLALPFKLLGKKFVFDHHDICPELYEAKFGKRGLFWNILSWCERATFRAADLVISANDTFRELAISRGGKRPEDVTTVYSVPTSTRMRRTEADPAVRDGCRLVVGYIGIIGGQDGVDHLVRAVAELARDPACEGVRTVVVGDGPALPGVRALAEELGVADRMVFTGYLSGDALLAAVSSFDVGVIPDPLNVYNDKISMNKVFEYAALGLPFAAYPLSETRRLASDAAVYAQGDQPEQLAAAVRTLIVDEALRRRTAERSAAVAAERFSWPREAAKLTAAYDRLVAPPALVAETAPAEAAA